MRGFSTNDRKEISSYNQIFRNGIYEIYSTALFYKTRHNDCYGFDGESLIHETIDSIKEGLYVLNEFKVEPPFLISFSFHNVLGKLMENRRNSSLYEFKRNEILFPLILIPTYESDILSLLKPNFDILWQSFGFSKSLDVL